MEVRGTGRGRPAGDGRRLVDHPGRVAQAPGLVEDDYFSRRLHGRDLGPPWDTVDWDADPDWEWHSAAADTPEELMTIWRDAVARSRSAITQAVDDGGLGLLATGISNSRGEAPSLRRLLID